VPPDGPKKPVTIAPAMPPQLLDGTAAGWPGGETSPGHPATVERTDKAGRRLSDALFVSHQVL